MIQFRYPEGATPFRSNEALYLIPKHITTQAELDSWEQQNITKAELKFFSRKDALLLSVPTMQSIHKKMFDDTWQWAGVFRQHETNIGSEYVRIRIELTQLCGNIQYEIDLGIQPIRRIAARLHHQLTWIHPFPNGNGRFARLYTDLLLYNYGEKRFSWGKASLIKASATRTMYISALKSADAGDYEPLYQFVES